MSYLLRGRLQELQCKQLKADGQRQLTDAHMESDRCVYNVIKSNPILHVLNCMVRLTQEADKRILELKDTVASLYVSLSEKDKKIMNLKETLDSNEKV